MGHLSGDKCVARSTSGDCMQTDSDGVRMNWLTCTSLSPGRGVLARRLSNAAPETASASGSAAGTQCPPLAAPWPVSVADTKMASTTTAICGLAHRPARHGCVGDIDLAGLPKSRRCAGRRHVASPSTDRRRGRRA